MERHYKPESGWQRNQAEQRAALLGLRKAHAAFDRMLEDHGPACGCELCHEATGMTYVLWMFYTTLESLAHPDVVLPRRELRQAIREAMNLERPEGETAEELRFDESRCWRCQRKFLDPDKEHEACPRCTEKRLAEHRRRKAKKRPAAVTAG